MSERLLHNRALLHDREWLRVRCKRADMSSWTHSSGLNTNRVVAQPSTLSRQVLPHRFPSLVTTLTEISYFCYWERKRYMFGAVMWSDKLHAVSYDMPAAARAILTTTPRSYRHISPHGLVPDRF